MAVANPQDINVAPYYGNIINSINNQAEIASRPRPDSGVTTALKTIAPIITNQIQKTQEMEREKKLLEYKAVLQDKLEKNKNLYESEKEGTVPITQQDLNEAFKQHTGNEKYAPIIPGGKTIRMKPEDFKKLLDSGKIDIQIEDLAKRIEVTDPVKAAAIRAAGQKGAEEYLKEGGKPIRVSPSLTPALREQSLRKEFSQKVKDTGFLSKRDAYTGALNALKNVSVPNDINLIYSVAKARDNTGRLSDQDIEQAAKAGNLPGDIQRVYNTVTTTKKLLPDEVRKTLVNSVIQSYKQGENNLSILEATYTDLSNNENLDPKNIVTSFRPKIDDEGTKIMTDPKTKKRYKVRISDNKVLGEANE